MQPTPLRGSTIAVLAVIAGVAVANLYFCQPILTLIDRSFPGTGTVVPTLTFAGYAFGILLLVPLGDRVARRKLIASELLLLALASLTVALAPNAVTLLTASAAIGVFATAAQQAVPLAAELAPDAARGRVIGLVMTGLLLGILLARTVSGVVGAAFGWRPVFGAASAIAAVLSIVAWRLPGNAPARPLGYGALLASLAGLIRRHRGLRVASLQQALLFGAFSMFWVTLVLLLEEPYYGLGAREAGLFGILGAAGALVPPLAGRVADRYGAPVVALVGTTLVLIGFGLFGLFGERSLYGLGAGVLVMDVGIQMTLIANQTRIYALDSAARGRLNTVFVTGIFIGGTAGSLAGVWAWSSGGWPAVCGAGSFAVAMALGLAIRDAVPRDG